MDMKAKKKPVGETSNADTAAKVVTPTRKYFVPGYGEVAARDISGVREALDKRNQTKEVQHGTK